uniref:Uncharacterized protein n=1 Tax=Avena sativa TaxID=4498 RepID=A0ACD5WMD3_AVESA
MRSARHQLAVSALQLLLLLLAVVPAARAQQETEDELEFSYVSGSENGPENWGNIKEEWATCGTGRMQSPIDLPLSASASGDLTYLNHTYRPAEASLVNRGHDIQVKFAAAAGTLWINGTAYHLRQLHWHSPSEHTVDGRRYDMELHMVHMSADDKAAVIGLLYEIGGRDDNFLHQLEPYLRSLAETKEKEVNAGVVDPWDARGDGQAYYRYMGSLTTPSCDEGVIWTVINRVATVSSDQLKLLTDAIHDGMEMNARPLQKVNGRDISLFYPDDHREHYYAVADH